MNICLAWSPLSPKWVELKQGVEVLEEVEIFFPLKALPSDSFASVEEALDWLLQKERKMAKNYALYWLARQSLASTIISQKLQAKGYRAQVCAEVIEACQAYFSDEEYWIRIVEKELAKGYGPRWIAWKWRAKGLPQSIVDKVATSERQRGAMQRIKSKHKDPKKAFRALMQRGFSPDVILS
jgi:SOS response regulatory protein OraA/RecX